MAVNSLVAAFSLGQQAAKDTAADDFITTLATVSGLQPRFDITESRQAHPGGLGTRATSKRAASTRTGYLVDAAATFVLRPRFIGKALLAAGFTVSTANNTTHYTHTFKLATRATFPWMSALWLLPDDDVAEFELLSSNMRATQLNVNATPDEVACDMTLTGMTEGDAAGTETKVAEIGVEILPTVGTMTVAGVSITVAKGLNMAIANTLKEDQRYLFQAARTDLPQESIGVSGTLTGSPLNRDIYREIFRGGTSGTAPSLTPLTGNLVYEFRSASNISGASVPYSLNIDINSCEYTIADNSLRANLADEIEPEISWEMIDDVTDPIVITLINDVSSYAGT